MRGWAWSPILNCSGIQFTETNFFSLGLNIWSNLRELELKKKEKKKEKKKKKKNELKK